MRRKDREVTEINEIFHILERCDTVRLAMLGEDYPYVVPLSFGAELREGKIVVYFHCAREGRKVERLLSCPRVCLEGDIFYKTETTPHGITTRYESVIGFGECRFVEENEEIVRGLKLLTEHYGYRDYPLEDCRALSFIRLGKIVLEEVSGKRNLPAT